MRLHVFNCSATSHGGCFYVEAGAEFAAPLHLRSCNAEGTGGAIYAQGILLGRQQINCSHCNAPTAGCLQLESGEAHIDTMTAMTLQSSSSLLPASSTVAAGANTNVTLGRMDCRQVPGCTFGCREDAAGSAPVSARRKPAVPGRRRRCGVPRMPNG